MKITILVFLLSNFFSTVTYAGKVLVTIGESGQITEQQLESAMRAAPFATQFPSMDEDNQAYLRGDMLLRLARAEALYQEAVALGKDQSLQFKQEMGSFKTALLAQRYLVNLRQKIQIPKEIEQQLSTQFQNNSDSLTAARSAYIAKHFSTLKDKNINKLIDQANIKTYYEQLDNSPTADTILAKGNELSIKYGDLTPLHNQSPIDKTRVIDKVKEWIKLILTAKAAVAQGENVEPQLLEYSYNLTTRLLLTDKQQQWIPDDTTLRDYFQKHPHIGYIPERRQIGQIVLATETAAMDMRTRIMSGESLFELAGQYSIDPYGRQRSGDMGWLKQGSAAKEIENAINKLKDNEISEIIKSDKGWHLITIVNRKPAEHKNYASIKDRVREKLIAEKMAYYLKVVTEKYPIQWKIEDHI